ncbi:solute carrier organic anion transporter family member 4C1-like [Ptychodera flava]|uniref:solute carrier organic anion transporter family member 4C1-like n=1 Tax=Ptychodera flava TaxID=63121 RepID=UPI00396A14AF
MEKSEANGEAATDTVDNGSIKENGSIAMEVVEESLDCGWFGIRPNWLQRFNTAPWLAAAISTLMFVQGLVINGFVYISLSTIETRYGFPSTASGIIVATYDLTVVVLILFVSYFGATRNKSRMLGIGTVIMGFGSLMWVLPQLTSGYYNYDTGYGEEEVLCRRQENATSSTDCDEDFENVSYYFIIFILAQVLHGIGASPIYTVGIAYVDENVSHDRSAWYMGVLNASSIFGPCVGFLFGAIFLSFWVDPTVADDVTITPDDPSWVGAWWIGFVIGCVCAWLVAIPVGAFPHELPETKNLERKCTAHYNDDLELLKTKSGFGRGWKDMWPATKMLLKNPTYMLVCFAKAVMSFVLAGFTPFVPKFIENQFGLTSSVAAIILAATAIPGAAGGTLLGGWIVKKGKLEVKGTAKFSLLITVLTFILMLVFMLKCPTQPVAGVVVPYEKHEEMVFLDLDQVNLTHACNVDCQCGGTGTYSPVCGDNDLVYFDACYAGCTDTPDEGKTYYNCSCIDSDDPSEPEAFSGKCSIDCWEIYVFIVFFFFIMLLGFLVLAPTTILTLRCVPDVQRSYALGVSSILYRILGTIPGPIVIGALIDSSCLVWQEVCDVTGSCWIYDNDAFGLKFTVVGMIGFGISSLLYVAMIWVYKPPPEENQEELKPSDSMQPISSMEAETKAATIQRETSTVSLLGFTKNDPDVANTETEIKQ